MTEWIEEGMLITDSIAWLEANNTIKIRGGVKETVK